MIGRTAIDARRVVRERLADEILEIRERDALLADQLDHPVAITSAKGPALRSGSELRPGRGFETILRHGWAAPEGWGVWSEGSKATVEVTFDRDVICPIFVELELKAFVRPGLSQRVMISVSSRRASTAEFSPDNSDRIEIIEITEGDLSAELSAEIAFDISNPTAPADVEQSGDRRELGVALQRLKIR